MTIFDVCLLIACFAPVWCIVGVAIYRAGVQDGKGTVHETMEIIEEATENSTIMIERKEAQKDERD